MRITKICVLTLALAGNSVAGSGNRVTILYDAFGKDPVFRRDWGYAALVEYGGKRILFDTGNNAEIFAANVKSAKVDLTRLDFVVVSHRHLDHSAGISYLLKVNPDVKIYTPKELAGPFGGNLPATFYRRDSSLATHEHYFGDQPEPITFGTTWVGGKFEFVDRTIEVAPGIYIISLVSEVPGTRDLRELSLALKTPAGLVLVAGCSHPGIEKIVETAAAIDPRVHLIFGGFHLPAAPDEQVLKVAMALHDTWKIGNLAPGHCTGEPMFAQLKKLWGSGYRYAGVGTVIELP